MKVKYSYKGKWKYFSNVANACNFFFNQVLVGKCYLIYLLGRVIRNTIHVFYNNITIKCIAQFINKTIMK